jgi:glycosyltransferase A (GT-A) superfamily protein (DUF2064 family)
VHATVVILTKLPGLMPVKTRLVPRLGVEGARRAYVAMLRATLELARDVDPRPTLAYSPPEADPEAALPGFAACRFRPVEGSDGARCLENALRDAYVGRPLVALGGDSPDLPRTRLREVVAALDSFDAALVPTGDGGFSCLGLRQPVAGLGGALPYGHPDAIDPVARFIEACGLRVHQTDPWPDVDTPAQYDAYLGRLGARRTSNGLDLDLAKGRPE